MRVVHYLNQFFGGIGAGEQAPAWASNTDGAIGPARFWSNCWGRRYIVNDPSFAAITMRSNMRKS